MLMLHSTVVAMLLEPWVCKLLLTIPRNFNYETIPCFIPFFPLFQCFWYFLIYLCCLDVVEQAVLVDTVTCIAKVME